MIKRWRDASKKRYRRWIDWRLPPVKKVVLDNPKLFILPTSAGFVFLGLLVLLWLIATNFENNLIFAFTFLLAALFIVSVFHTFLNLLGLQVEGGKTTAGFVGQFIEFELLLTQAGKRYRHSIELSCPGVDRLVVSLKGRELKPVYLAIPVLNRGWFTPERITLKSVYPLGLLKVWTYVKFDCSALVYPRPLDSPLPPQMPMGEGDTYINRGDGGEDFIGLEKYRPGESLRHVAWKQYAREQGLQTKHYADAIDDKFWLDWDALPGLDIEARLSRLCGWVLRCCESSQTYGLRLPGVELAPNSGRSHRDAVLRELALYSDNRDVGTEFSGAKSRADKG